MKSSSTSLLAGKLALVTGGAAGLGAAISAGLAKHGASVIVADVNEAGARDVAAKVSRTGGVAHAFGLDVTNRRSVYELADYLLSEVGPIDILINNAGIAAAGKFDAAQFATEWDRTMLVNLQGTLNVSHAFVPALKQTRGTIVNLCSITAFSAGVSSIGYVVSKGGVRSLTQAMARDLAPYGVRVNAIAPGVMDTAMTKPQRDTPHGLDWYLSRTPMARTGKAQEVIGPIVFLASEMASYITGVILPVDGGYLSA